MDVERKRRLIDYALCFLAANADEEQMEELEAESLDALVNEIHEVAQENQN